MNLGSVEGNYLTVGCLCCHAILLLAGCLLGMHAYSTTCVMHIYASVLSSLWHTLCKRDVSVLNRNYRLHVCSIL